MSSIGQLSKHIWHFNPDDYEFVCEHCGFELKLEISRESFETIWNSQDCKGYAVSLTRAQIYCYCDQHNGEEPATALCKGGVNVTS